MRTFQILLPERVLEIKANRFSVNSQGQAVFYDQKDRLCGLAPNGAIITEIV